MWPDPQETTDLVIFTEQILNRKRNFLCSVNIFVFFVCFLFDFLFFFFPGLCFMLLLLQFYFALTL